MSLPRVGSDIVPEPSTSRLKTVRCKSDTVALPRRYHCRGKATQSQHREDGGPAPVARLPVVVVGEPRPRDWGPGLSEGLSKHNAFYAVAPGTAHFREKEKSRKSHRRRYVPRPKRVDSSAQSPEAEREPARFLRRKSRNRAGALKTYRDRGGGLRPHAPENPHPYINTKPSHNSRPL